MKLQCADRQHNGRIQIEDQALEIGADVLQAAEVEKAGEIVAAETQPGEQPEVSSGEGSRSRPAHHAIARNSGSANSIRYMMRVTASTPYR